MVGWTEKIDGWLDGQKKQMDNIMDYLMDRKKWMVGCMDKKIDGWLEGCITNMNIKQRDGWMDRKKSI